MLHLHRAVIEVPPSADEPISVFTAEPDKLADLLQHWDQQHQKLFADKRAAMLEKKEGHAEVIPQWPEWSGGNLKEDYMSSLEKVNMYSALDWLAKVCSL